MSAASTNVDQSALLSQLQSQEAIHLSESGLSTLIEQITTENSRAISTKALKEAYLHSDLKGLSEKVLPDNINTAKKETIDKEFQLQVVSVSNIAQPTTKQRVNSGNRLLSLRLTDGHIRCTAVEYLPVKSLSIDTPPGTKLLLRRPEVRNGKILLTPTSVEVLGGQVDALVNSWRANRALAEQKRLTSNTDHNNRPPAFKEFDTNIKKAKAVAVPRTESAPSNAGAKENNAPDSKTSRDPTKGRQAAKRAETESRNLSKYKKEGEVNGSRNERDQRAGQGTHSAREERQEATKNAEKGKWERAAQPDTAGATKAEGGTGQPAGSGQRQQHQAQQPQRKESNRREEKSDRSKGERQRYQPIGAEEVTKRDNVPLSSHRREGNKTQQYVANTSEQPERQQRTQNNATAVSSSSDVPLAQNIRHWMDLTHTEPSARVMISVASVNIQSGTVPPPQPLLIMGAVDSVGQAFVCSASPELTAGLLGVPSIEVVIQMQQQSVATWQELMHRIALLHQQLIGKIVLVDLCPSQDNGMPLALRLDFYQAPAAIDTTTLASQLHLVDLEGTDKSVSTPPVPSPPTTVKDQTSYRAKDRTVQESERSQPRREHTQANHRGGRGRGSSDHGGHARGHLRGRKPSQQVYQPREARSGPS